MNPNYFLHGQFTAKDGQGDQLESILLRAADLIQEARGCRLYVISRDEADPESVWVTEVWDSSEDHDESLNLPGVKELIMEAMPLLANPPQKGQVLTLKGGHGIS